MEQEKMKVKELKKGEAVIVDELNDRFVFLSCDDKDEIVGLNFHFGIELCNDSFRKPDIHLTEIYTRVCDNAKRFNETLTTKQRIDKAISLYVQAFIVQ